MTGPLENALFLTYGIALSLLGLMGCHRLLLLYRLWRYGGRDRESTSAVLSEPAEAPRKTWPCVTVQLPIYNERYVAERLVRAAAAFEYPNDCLEVQVLDDSTDDTTERLARVVEELRAAGRKVELVRRPERTGFKAGALSFGLRQAEGELIAVFDADFLPPRDWLKRVVPDFERDPGLGMLQTRWRHLNAGSSLLTRLQAIYLDCHFAVEHRARHLSGCYFNFNGTAGIWRRQAIVDAGDWSAETLTEDLDLSYRAQLAGWRFAYRDDIGVPAELPEEMSAYRNQQHRWSKGAMQVLRRIGARLLLHRQSTWRQKLEALAHLGGNLSYPLMLLLAVVMPPVLLLRERYRIAELEWVDAAVFLFGTCSVGLFYFYVQRREGESRLRALANVPLVMSFGIGMSLSNARAVLSGMLGFRSPFLRTAKYGEVTAADTAAGGTSFHWARKEYVTRAAGAMLLEYTMTAWSLGALGFAALRGIWLSLPILALFVAGFGLCATFSTVQYLAVRRAHRRANTNYASSAAS